MEQENPELKDKALELLGPVLYYDLCPKAGEPLDPSMSEYKKLMKIYEKVEEEFETEVLQNQSIQEQIQKMSPKLAKI